MRRTILLLGTAALVLVLVGGVATSKQRQQESTSSQSSTTNKSEDDVSIQSTRAKASFASGSGANRLSVQVSNHGNLLSFESPADKEAVYNGSEGYALCSGGFGVHGHDTGDTEAGFDPPTFSQPNGPGTFPLTVTRNTTDGKLQLKQVWSTPDATEKAVTLTMRVTNSWSNTLTNVDLARTGDFDVGETQKDQGASTGDSTWLWDDLYATDRPPVGLMLTALTFGTPHVPRIEPSAIWSGSDETDPTRDQCLGVSEPTPTSVSDYTMRMTYLLGNLSAGQSKTVKLVYERI